MSELTDIRPGMQVVGADGVPVGTVEAIEDGRIRLVPVETTEGESAHGGHSHYFDGGLVAEVEGETVRLSANASVAMLLDEEADGKPAD
ncbi:DUF2171 domain-containing protein [Devosia nitrariae]|uniref:DUF2171 domain-containing protein n=1 Tax=Devosia nitrariae TaxID=2071872 RepID=A0ABQ5VZZ0_9HYPH|nr:DUF2171 domain-containing protein [Devosia nitrariae]GLQ53379.1 hypothetical protein GCM10010862_06370 [Devosia nitrariae]